MKKYCFFLGLAGLLATLQGKGQDLSGLGTGNYAPLSGVNSNPANIADSRYRFDINLFSMEVMAGLAVVAVQGPSVMFGVGSKWGFAISTRARVVSNVRNLDSKLFDAVNKGSSSGLAYTFSPGGDEVINVNAWSEIGVSVARELLHEGVGKGKHQVCMCR